MDATLAGGVDYPVDLIDRSIEVWDSFPSLDEFSDAGEGAEVIHMTICRLLIAEALWAERLRTETALKRTDAPQTNVNEKET